MNSKYQEYLKLNKNILIAFAASIIISAVIAQILSDQDDLLNTMQLVSSNDDKIYSLKLINAAFQNVYNRTKNIKFASIISFKKVKSTFIYFSTLTAVAILIVLFIPGLNAAS